VLDAYICIDWITLVGERPGAHHGLLYSNGYLDGDNGGCPASLDIHAACHHPIKTRTTTGHPTHFYRDHGDLF